MERLAPGTRVKLTGKAVKGYLHGYHRKGKVDWLKRRGTLHCASRTYAYVVWDGTKSADQMPIKAIEEETET